MKVTNRDINYLQTIFFLGGNKNPINPTNLGNKLNVTKVTAYQKMKRLAIFGFGTYIRQKGFLLNRKSIIEIERTIYQHHVLEKFFTQTLGISCDQACQETSQINGSLSEDFINKIHKKLGEPSKCNCGCKISPPYTQANLQGCNWCVSSFSNNNTKS